MNSQNKQAAKSIGINLGSMAGIITAYAGIYYAGVLNPLQDISVLGYNLAQIIFMILISVGVGSIVYPVFSKKKSFDEAKSEIEQLLQQTTGSSENQVKHFEDEIIDNAKKRYGFHGKIKDLKAKIMRTAINGSFEFSVQTPVELAQEFKKLKTALLSKLRHKQVLAANSENSENYTGESLCILTSANIDISEIETYEQYKSRSLWILAIFIALSAIIYIIHYLVK